MTIEKTIESRIRAIAYCNAVDVVGRARRLLPEWAGVTLARQRELSFWCRKLPALKPAVREETKLGIRQWKEASRAA